MKYFLLLLTFFAVFTLQAQKAVINPSLQKKYLPDELKTLYIGMTVQELRKARPYVKVPENEFEIDCKEKFSAGNIKEVTYQMHLADSSIYEFIVEYGDAGTATAIARKMYKAPNFANTVFPLRWKFTLKDGTALACWIFKNKICIADYAQTGFE